MIEKTNILKLIDLYFQTRTIQISKSQIENIAVLLGLNIVEEVDDKLVKINIKSESFLNVLWEYIESKIDEQLSNDIKQAFEQIDEFERAKKEEYGCSNIINAYSTLIDAFKSYVIYTYHTKEILNVFDFFKLLPDEEKYHYDKYVIDVILLLDNIEISTVYNILSLIKSNEVITRVPDFCSKLGKDKPDTANNLYDYSLQKQDKNDFYILSNLLFGLYEIHSETTFAKAKNLLTYNTSLAYFTLGRLKYNNSKHLSECFEIANNVDVNDMEGLLQVPYIYKSLIENKNTPDNIRKQCFAKMGELFCIENEQLKNSIFFDCQIIDGYEEERYNLLVGTFLSKSQNYFKGINDYFENFTNSDYFFDLFSMLYNISYEHNGIRFSTKPFEHALSHFWNKDRERTEQHLLNLLSHDVSFLRIGAVDLIRSKHFGIYDVDLHKLDTEQKQLRALEALFFQSYFNVDAILPLILSLHNSEYPNVIAYLQQKLSELIIEAYHDHIYDKVIELINDEHFLEPIKQALDYYHKIKEIKSSVNDLNPKENERDLVELYFSLEHEENKKLMSKARSEDNSFMALCKNTVIVRGNSWKIRDNEISPLGKHEHTFTMDMRMYKNPDLFDYSHNYFNSQF
ncbi:hypothetical protein FACS189432_04590 [Bacteroidia bacterium]|nr:hypothetical protein FACS189426_04900 [Bacteroidia bacterium]GHT27688.1 hypothetical protein FACS189432_04590 [Bacteroidia bacterium]